MSSIHGQWIDKLLIHCLERLLEKLFVTFIMSAAAATISRDVMHRKLTVKKVQVYWELISVVSFNIGCIFNYRCNSECFDSAFKEGGKR